MVSCKGHESKDTDTTPQGHWHRHTEWEKQHLESSLNFWKNFCLHLANTAWYKNLYHCFLFPGLIFSPSFHNCAMLTIASSPNICQTMRARDGESEAWINQPIHMVKIEFLRLVLVFLNCFNFLLSWHQGVAWMWGEGLSPTQKGYLLIALSKMK